MTNDITGWNLDRDSGDGSGSPQTTSAAQGSQPTIGGLRIGVIDAATRDGVSKARLLLRPPSGDKAVTIGVGETIEVPGAGSVTLDEVVLGDADDSRPRVTITVAPAA